MKNEESLHSNRTARLPNLLVDEHISYITKCWSRSTDALVELSIACRKANDELNAALKKQLVEELPFGGSMFSKFVQIGTDARLTDPERRTLLPVNMSALYELTQFTDDEFRGFEADGHLTKRLRRTEVIGWRRKRREEGGEMSKHPVGPKLPSSFYAALKPNRQLASTEEGTIGTALNALAEQFEMHVVYPEAKPRLRALENALRKMRREAKKLVAETVKRRREKLGPHAFTNKPALRKYAGFSADDVEIEPDADEDRIRDVLTAIDRQDEFGPIRNAAYREYRLDEPSETPQWMDAVSDRPPPAAAQAADMKELREQWQAMARPELGGEEMKARLAGVK